MKSFTAVAAAAAVAASASAQQYTQSAPFSLILSGSPKYNGANLTACHIGAAIESLCVIPGADGSDNSKYTTYTFNTTDNQAVSNPSLGKSGLLIWTLPGSDYNYEETFGLYTDISTNVATGVFGLGTTQVAFDSENKLNIQSFLNDTVTPPTEQTNAAYYRWFICETNFEGYVYENLAWVYGDRTPQNPSCNKVQVTRKFI